MNKPLFPTRSAILSRLGVAFLTWRRYLQRNLLVHDITLKQLYVLRQLDRAVYLYPSDIADMLFCDRPTATVILDNLEKQDWIRRERDIENRKFIRISITPSGRQKLADLGAVEWGTVDPLADFTEEEIQQFDHLLKKLKKNLDTLPFAEEE